MLVLVGELLTKQKEQFSTSLVRCIKAFNNGAVKLKCGDEAKSPCLLPLLGVRMMGWMKDCSCSHVGFLASPFHEVDEGSETVP